MATFQQNALAALTLIGGMTAASLVVIPAIGAEGTGSISGTVFEDTNRDGVHQPDEVGFPNVLLYVFDATGSEYRGNTRTDENGSFNFNDLGHGGHLLTVAPTSWRDYRADWTPSNAPSIEPSWPVTVADGQAPAPMGLRRIVRSTDQPLSSLVGPSGVTIESYNDVVTAQQIHDVLLEGVLIGPEAAVTTITHDAGSSTSCGIGASRKDGVWASYSARCNIAWMSWLTGAHDSLFHEYGHAWSLYHAYLTQQDTNLTGYLEVRGLVGDERLDTSHAWSRREMIAEDYRQLFGSPTARAAAQENRDIPVASDVPGLLEYLRDEHTSSGGTPDDDADPTPDPDSTADPTPDPTDDAADTVAPEVEILSPSDGSSVNGSFTVVVRASDNVSVPDALTVKVRLGNGDAVTAAWDAATGRFRATLNTRGLKGTQTVSVVGRDQAGNRSESAADVEISKGGGGGTSGKGRGKG